jgi:hypothetical protein
MTTANGDPVAKTSKPAPASAQSRATKASREEFLAAWAMENPLATIEEAREAVRKEFGISLGTQILSKTMRLAKDSLESQRRATLKQEPVAVAPPPTAPAVLHEQINLWTATMKAAGVRLIEILDDGKIRVEFNAS